MPQSSRLRFLSLLAATLMPSLVNAQTANQTGQIRTPVLVELFTSEGCSSCPPADALLAQLDRDQPIRSAEVIVLSEHVDYWDQLGWHDRFSSSLFTERQRQYSLRFGSESYTPQMVVAGTDQFVGSDAARARQSIQHAAQTPALTLSLSHPVVDGSRVSATVTSTSTSGQQGDLYAALVQPSAVTEVRRGENGGRRLQHAGVVRSLQHIGNIKDLTAGRTFSLTAPNDVAPAFLRIVVFAQAKDQKAILGANAVNITP